MKDSDQIIKSNELAGDFIEALRRGFKNEALVLVSNSEFDPNAGTGLPLGVAIELGYLDIALQLIRLGADSNLRADSRKGALVLALENEYFELADAMLQHGAEISARDQNGWTPLIWASIKGYGRVVEYLIENGADLHICSDDGWNALTGAFFKQHTGIVDLLTKHGAHFGRKYREAALLSAYQHGSHNIVRSLIEAGINVNIGTSDGQPLLILVLARGDQDILELLLDAGADPNIRSKQGNPALLDAILFGQYQSAMRLIERGASVNVNGPKWAPIHAAADHGRVELCKALLDAGASLNHLSPVKRTALMQASERKHADVVEFLMERGADPNLRDEKGITARRLSLTSQDILGSPSNSTQILDRFGAIA